MFICQYHRIKCRHWGFRGGEICEEYRTGGRKAWTANAVSKKTRKEKGGFIWVLKKGKRVVGNNWFNRKGEGKKMHLLTSIYQQQKVGYYVKCNTGKG